MSRGAGEGDEVSVDQLSLQPRAKLNGVQHQYICMSGVVMCELALPSLIAPATQAMHANSCF